MNAQGYIKSISILVTSFLLMLGFNNCSEVGFKQIEDASNNKIGVMDTSELGGMEVTDENADDIDQMTEVLAEEQAGEGSEDEEAGSEGESEGDLTTDLDDTDDDSSVKDNPGQKKQCDKKKDKDGSSSSDIARAFKTAECEEFEGEAANMPANARQMICHSSASGKWVKLCLPQGAVAAHLREHNKDNRTDHVDYLPEDPSAPCGE